MVRLQAIGCHNINFVTPTHVTPMILEALPYAIEGGLRIPLVYNCGGYESVDTLKILDGIIDIYMPDIKYTGSEPAREFSNAKDYPEKIKAALKEMHRQVGDLVLDSEGIAVRGLLVRHLVLPGGLAGTEEAMRFLAEELSPDTYVNVMDQYRPNPKKAARIAKTIWPGCIKRRSLILSWKRKDGHRAKKPTSSKAPPIIPPNILPNIVRILRGVTMSTTPHGKIHIGKKTHIGESTIVFSDIGIQIGDNVIIGPQNIIIDFDREGNGDDFAIFIIGLVLGFSCSLKKETVMVPSTGKVCLQVEPASSEVYVDGKEIEVDSVDDDQTDENGAFRFSINKGPGRYLIYPNLVRFGSSSSLLAERFGLSQLHQLRGRVGRGKDPSQCLMIAQYRKTEEAERRLAQREVLINRQLEELVQEEKLLRQQQTDLLMTFDIFAPRSSKYGEALGKLEDWSRRFSKPIAKCWPRREPGNP
jgi:acetyltransferase-like isoleucine patch superfamily enzyme